MDSASVIVIGSINVDLIVTVPRLPTAGESVIGGDVIQQGGGKSANQATAAARVGADVALVGAVGRDELGASALDELAASAVDTGGCVSLESAPTGVALIVVDAEGENQIAVAPGANWALDGPTTRERLDRLSVAPGAVCLLGLEISDAAVEAASAWADDVGLPVVLNPAPARELSPSVLRRGPILTPNATEAQILSGEAEPEAAARDLARRTLSPVIVTLGSEGALLFDSGQVTRVPSIAVDVIDTTGAGDALNGILAAELARGATLVDALRWAVAGASLSTTSQGARAGAPTRAAIASRLG